jgi:hypothetical protein
LHIVKSVRFVSKVKGKDKLLTPKWDFLWACHKKIRVQGYGVWCKKRTCIIPKCVKHSKKHWSDSSSWTMAKFMHQVVIKVIKVVIQIICYIAFSSMMKFLQLTTNYGCLSTVMWRKIG